jgi:hypothetical protein
MTQDKPTAFIKNIILAVVVILSAFWSGVNFDSFMITHEIRNIIQTIFFLVVSIVNIYYLTNPKQ